MVKDRVFCSWYRIICACALVCAALFVFAPKAFAAEVTPTDTSVVDLIPATEPADLPVVKSDTYVDTFNPNDVVSVEIVRSSSPVTPTEANGLKKLLLQLIGDYDMVTCEYTYTSSNGYTSKQVTTEPDYSWMISAGLFIIVLWSLFRFVGGLVSAKR